MLDELRLLLRNWLLRPLKPGPIYLYSEAIDMTNFRLKVLLPPIQDADVGKRVLKYKINDQDEVVKELPKESIETTITAPRAAQIHMELKDVDVENNESEASVRDFTVVDTIAPHKPGEIGVEVIEQFEDGA